MFQPPAQIAQDMENRKKGYRFCGSCGRCNIGPDEPEWKTRCSDCHASNRPYAFCIRCGDELEKSRIEWAKKRGGECKKCWACSKLGKRSPCDECGLVHPDHWHSPMLAELLTNPDR